MRSQFLFLGICLVLAVQCQSTVGSDLCESVGSGTVAVKCTGCDSFKYCFNGRLSDHDVYCGMKFCDDDLLGTAAAPCSAKVPVGCPGFMNPGVGEEPPEAGSITCTGVGIYPDPADCSIYHYCPEVGQSSWTQQCPPDYAFAYTSPTASDQFPCKQIKLSSTDCAKIDCTTAGTKKYGSSTVFYAQCADSGDATMFKCSDGATFDGTKCNLKCTKEGLFANTIDPNKYYWCYYEGNSLKADERSCPKAEQKFNASKYACV